MKSKLICTFGAMILTVVCSNFAGAADLSYKQMDSSSDIAFFTSHSTRIPSCRADVIIYKTREVNGVKQYRRWNETKGCWVDPEWINVPT